MAGPKIRAAMMVLSRSVQSVPKIRVSTTLRRTQSNVDFLPQFPGGGAHPVSNELDAAFHGGAHEMNFIDHGAAKCADKESGQSNDQPEGVEGESDILQHGIEEEVQHTAPKGDVQDLQKLRLAKIFAFHQELPEKKATVKGHGKSADFDMEHIGDGGDGSIHRQNPQTCFYGESHSAVDQDNAQKGR